VDVVFELIPPEGLPTGSLVGRVFRPDGRTPAAGVWVAPYAPNAPSPGANAVTRADRGSYKLNAEFATLTGDDGGFVIEGLRPGSYGLYATPRPGSFRPNHVPAPEIAKLAPTMGEPVEVKAREKTAEVRLVLPEGCAVSGVVRNAATKQPVPDATVWPEQTSPNPIPFTDLQPIHTDHEGKYRLEGLPAGKYQLLAFGQNLSAPPVTVSLEAGDDLAVDFELTPNG